MYILLSEAVVTKTTTLFIAFQTYTLQNSRGPGTLLPDLSPSRTRFCESQGVNTLGTSAS